MTTTTEGETKPTFSLSDLPKQVREFWAATGIPIVELMICLLVIGWCANIGIADVERSVAAFGSSSNIRSESNHLPDLEKQVDSSDQRDADIKGESKRETDVFGLSKLLPLAAIVVFLGVAQGVAAFVRMLGSTFPVHAGYRLNVYLADQVPLDVIEPAWARYPAITDLVLLSARIDEDVDRSETIPDAKVHFYRSRELKPEVDGLDSRRRFLVGLIIVGVITWVVQDAFASRWPSHMEVKRLVAFVILAVAVGVYLNLSYLKTWRLYHYRKFADFNAWKDNSSTSGALSPESLLQAASALRTYLISELSNGNSRVFFSTGNADLEFDPSTWKQKAGVGFQDLIVDVDKRVEALRRTISKPR